MKELAICVQRKDYGVTSKETVDAICKAGFKNVFVQYLHKDKLEEELDVIDYCKEKGLNIIFCHLSYNDINDIWLDEECGEKVTQSYIDDLDAMKSKGIDNVMMHLSTHKVVPMYNELGLQRVKRIVEHANKLGMKIGLENTRYQGYLEFVLGNIPDKTAGLCYDAGHVHVHFKDVFDYEFFKDRYYMVHLHDNHGDTEDEHLLPFDGTIDWKNVMKKLKENNYNGPITLELCYKNEYTKMSIEEFYKEAYRRGERLAKIWDEV